MIAVLLLLLLLLWVSLASLRRETPETALPELVELIDAPTPLAAMPEIALEPAETPLPAAEPAPAKILPVLKPVPVAEAAAALPKADRTVEISDEPTPLAAQPSRPRLNGLQNNRTSGGGSSGRGGTSGGSSASDTVSNPITTPTPVTPPADPDEPTNNPEEDTRSNWEKTLDIARQAAADQAGQFGSYKPHQNDSYRTALAEALDNGGHCLSLDEDLQARLSDHIGPAIASNQTLSPLYIQVYFLSNGGTSDLPTPILYASPTAAITNGNRWTAWMVYLPNDDTSSDGQWYVTENLHPHQLKPQVTNLAGLRTETVASFGTKLLDTSNWAPLGEKASGKREFSLEAAAQFLYERTQAGEGKAHDYFAGRNAASLNSNGVNFGKYVSLELKNHFSLSDGEVPLWRIDRNGSEWAVYLTQDFAEAGAILKNVIRWQPDVTASTGWATAVNHTEARDTYLVLDSSKFFPGIYDEEAASSPSAWLAQQINNPDSKAGEYFKRFGKSATLNSTGKNFGVPVSQDMEKVFPQTEGKLWCIAGEGNGDYTVYLSQERVEIESYVDRTPIPVSRYETASNSSANGWMRLTKDDQQNSVLDLNTFETGAAPAVLTLAAPKDAVSLEPAESEPDSKIDDEQPSDEPAPEPAESDGPETEDEPETRPGDGQAQDGLDNQDEPDAPNDDPPEEDGPSTGSPDEDEQSNNEQSDSQKQDGEPE